MLMLQTSMSQLARLSCTLQDNSHLGRQAGSVADCAPGVITTTAGIVKREALPDVCNHLLAARFFSPDARPCSSNEVCLCRRVSSHLVHVRDRIIIFNSVHHYICGDIEHGRLVGVLHSSETVADYGSLSMCKQQSKSATDHTAH